MYTEFYNLAERPFELTPDPRYVYLSAHHREALAHLKYGVEERKGFIQLTGEVGTGKTTMLDVLVSELDATTVVAKLSYTTIDELDLLRILARGFGIEEDTGSKAAILDLIRDLFAEWSKDGRNAVFVVDEAQNLSLPVLEEIRLLSNLRVNGKLSMQIILAGQPELRDKLEKNELRQLRQRIGIRYHLTPLSRQETGEYVSHRMSVAGSTERVFDAEAMRVVYEYSQGVPRVINMVCDRALLAGYAEHKRRVTGNLVRRAIDGLEGRPVAVSERATATEPEVGESAPVRPAERGSRGRVRWAAPLAVALVVAAVSVSSVLYFGWRERAEISPGEEAIAAHGVVVDTVANARSEPSSARGSDTDAITDEPAGGPAERREDSAARETRSPASGREEQGAVAEKPSEAVYFIVAESSRDLDAARLQVDKLWSEGMGASVWTVDLGERGLWHRIVLDAGFDSLAAAADAAEVLRGMGYADAWVVKR